MSGPADISREGPFPDGPAGRGAWKALSAEGDLSISADGAGCDLWWEETPKVPNYRVGCIGRLECPPNISAAPLLKLACDALRAQGCTLAVGPMDGNTWRNYRLVTDSDRSPPFPFEPVNPPSLSADFFASGFATMASYSSSSLPIRPQELGRISARIADRGITIREVAPSDFTGELRRLYPLCSAAFADNFLFSPLDESGFVGIYLATEKFLDPRYVLVAEDPDGVPAGFVFTYPNRATKPDALVVKTLAVHPEKRHLGLGSLLVAEVQNRALGRGIVRAIHALQHETNASLKISARHGANVFRRYALYSKILE